MPDNSNNKNLQMNIKLISEFKEVKLTSLKDLLQAGRIGQFVDRQFQLMHYP